MDIGHAVGKSLSQLETRQFLTSPWIPSKSFDFPVQVAANGKKRRFNWDWFHDYPWILYSAKLDGVFCKYCVLFATATNSQSLGSLCTSA